ncbi:hypothetical protein PsYK624_025280 [Phanerochaete sordida]|uniref:Secreted protein n=1 Tax=Phanerochaete sordida TaxID=48140 RepID=A0A9P3G023_9APHY|nr:hypothetical protein PsYK624_025280 [Phanerochaete sordida]
MFKCWSTFIVICAGIAFAHSTRRRDRFRGRALLNLSRHHGRTRSRRVCTAQQRRFTGAYTSCRPAASSDLQTASNQSRSSRSVAKRGASDRDGDVRIAVRQVPTHLRVAQEYLVSPPAALVVAFYPSVHFWPHSRASPR